MISSPGKSSVYVVKDNVMDLPVAKGKRSAASMIKDTEVTCFFELELIELFADDGTELIELFADDGVELIELFADDGEDIAGAKVELLAHVCGSFTSFL